MRLRILVVPLAAVSLLFLPSPPAHARASGTLYMTGTVSPDPLLTFLGSPSTPFAISRVGNGKMVGEFNFVPGECTLNYTDTGVATFVQESGSGGLSCTGVGISIACSTSYSRVGTTVVMNGSCTGTAGMQFTAALTVGAVTTTYAWSGPFVML